MKLAAWALQLGGLFCMFGAVTNVSVSGTTAMQAMLQYTAPDESPCVVEVSESPTLAPLVHDVDGQLFVGANLDNRSESTASGQERAFVVGKRRAEKSSNGRFYSRALQAYTAHYFRITCGADQASGSFTTGNIALGNTYSDELPADPNAGAATYFVASGLYAWPEFTDWNKDTGRSETVIDPHTGMLLKRVTMPQDQPTGNSPGGDHQFATIIDPDGAWVNKDGLKADDAVSASFSGTGRNWLVLRDERLTFGDAYPLEAMTFSVKGWCGGSCAGEDGQIQACITINGVSCWPDEAHAKILDLGLGTAANPSTFATVASAAPIMAAWTPNGYPPLVRGDVQKRAGNLSVDASGNASWVSGDYFYPNWGSGSRIAIAGSECRIVRFLSQKSLTIDPASCVPALGLPQASADYSAGNFGVMIRKKTASTETITIQYAKYSLANSILMGWTASGSPRICSNTATRNTATGAMGYHCVVSGGVPMLYWIDRETAQGNYLGMLSFSGQGGPDGWSGGYCNNSSTTLVGSGPDAPEKMYCIATDNSNKNVVLECTLTSSNQAGNLSTSCRNLTPASVQRDLVSLAANFTAGDQPSYDPSKFPACGISGAQKGRLIMPCNRGYQDTYAWVLVFDPAKVDSAPGCVGGGLPGCLVAASPTWAHPPARWCVSHTLFMAGDADSAWVAGKYMGSDPYLLGNGPYVSTVVSGSLGAVPSISAGSGGCPAGTKGCDLVTVDGEPCDPDPAAGEGGNCPKNASLAYLQDAKAGDVLYISNPGEYVRLAAKNGNTWLLERGLSNTDPGQQGTPTVLSEVCLAQPFDTPTHGVSNWSWVWDFLRDPHGLNADGTTMRIAYDFDHPIPRADAVVGGGPWYDSNNTYSIYEGPGFSGSANRYVSSAPPFAGTVGLTAFYEVSQDHVSRPQEMAPLSEQKWFLDGRPLSNLWSQLVDQAVLVSGQLYKFSSQTSDGDNLFHLGGPNAELGGLNRKKQPTMAFCGTQPLSDVSSAAQGDVISDTRTSGYTYCVTRKDGECRSGSVRGDIYMNCPVVTPRPDGTYGCGRSETDICVNKTGGYLNGIAQIGYQFTDLEGKLGRVLTKGLSRYRMADSNQNARTLPDASWLLIYATGLSGSRTDVLAGKLPPYPAVDSVNRGDFVPMTLTLQPPAKLAVDNAVVSFGYGENGLPEQFFCTSRREECLVTQSAIPDTVFAFPSDSPGGTAGLAGVPCSTGCTVAIPALPQRVLYYRVSYRNAANGIVAKTPTQAAIVP